jgi:hypothetical protein
MEEAASAQPREIENNPRQNSEPVWIYLSFSEWR